MNSAAWSWNDTFALILTGMIVVFIALIILIFIITLMGKISVGFSGNAASSKSQVKPPELKPVVNTPVPVPKKAVVQDGIEEEVVAVISATISAMSTLDTTYKIMDIKKSPQRKKVSHNSWARAGQIENTRPF